MFKSSQVVGALSGVIGSSLFADWKKKNKILAILNLIINMKLCIFRHAHHLLIVDETLNNNIGVMLLVFFTY